MIRAVESKSVVIGSIEIRGFDRDDDPFAAEEFP